ncbi:glycosyltransferase [Pseudomonas syringae]|uniref:Glycosyl transferase n=1 Tax=Pseudomonas viridiflava ICMP 13104 TaxID=1198305 RepID=A0A0W0HD71_PSEVI|nr:glycosyltransferase [Pseudomonas syringae]KTB58719.1 glycosyl transferase [Pseudomonas viridiflava ICMP 13104]
MNTSPPKVAVLMAAYNGMAWIEDQLESILKQVNVGVSVYISVDTSTDNTESWCSAYAERRSNVTMLPNAGPFGGAARNFFRLIRDVDFSSFDYVAFADQDDIWYPHKLERATSVLDLERYDAYSSNVVAFWPDGRRRLIDKSQPQTQLDYLFEAAGPGCTYVLTRKLALEFKMSLEEHWNSAQNVSLHDWYCYAFARSHDFRWFIDPAPGMDYRQHSGNQVGANVGIASLTTRLKNIADGWWLEQVLLIDYLTGRNPALIRKSEHASHLLILRLIFKAAQCRRRRRDKFLFIVACLASVIRN